MSMLEKICIENIGVQHSLGKNEKQLSSFLKKNFSSRSLNNLSIIMILILHDTWFYTKTT